MRDEADMCLWETGETGPSKGRPWEWFQGSGLKCQEEGAGPRKPQRPLGRVTVLSDYLSSGSDALILTLRSGPAAAWLMLGPTQV